MNRLSFLPSVNVGEVRAMGKREALIKDFAMQRSINVIWSPAGTGKTSLMFAISKALTELNQEVAFIDTDNGVDLLQDRGYDRHIETIGNKLRYINADMFDNPKDEIIQILKDIKEKANDSAYNNCVFIFDSLKFFLDGGIYDENKINSFIGFCKAIRRNGGIVFILNHATKKGDAMKGGSSIIDASDEVWEMQVLPSGDNEYRYILTPSKQRMNVKKVCFGVDRASLIIDMIDIEIAELAQNELEFIKKVQDELKDGELTQGELLAKLGKRKDDKTTKELLDKHNDRFWSFTKNGKKNIYTTITTVPLSQDMPENTQLDSCKIVVEGC